MIEINEKFVVAAAPEEVYAVMSDPYAVVECVAGAALKEQNPDGTYDGTMTVRFSALRVNFAGRISLELEPESLSGTVVASGRDGQGGTKFKATAHFTVGADAGGAVATVSGEVELNGKLASVIENAAGAVVRRMTGEFVDALSLRCASSATQLGPAEPATAAGAVRQQGGDEPEAGDPAPPAASAAGVVLLHDFGASPGALRPWGEALAAAGLSVGIPRLPGHGTRWKDLHATGAADWYAAADAALTEQLAQHERVFVMGLGLGAALALRLAQQRPGDVAGVVAVNPMFSAPLGTPKALGLMRLFRRSVRLAPGSDIKKTGARGAGYDRLSLRAVHSLGVFGAAVRAGLGSVTCPVLLATSDTDHVVAPADAEAAARAFSGGRHVRSAFCDSHHVVVLDNDAAELFAGSVDFIQSHALVSRP
jgi:esterase/lipase/carbon monoxide dehydrogenase subunit G